MIQVIISWNEDGLHTPSLKDPLTHATFQGDTPCLRDLAILLNIVGEESKTYTLYPVGPDSFSFNHAKPRLSLRRDIVAKLLVFLFCRARIVDGDIPTYRFCESDFPKSCFDGPHDNRKPLGQ